ncbi:ArsR/SmtB family transcription factor [Streptomyces sp. NPDC008001]|uniref:ArsR/SmtB family transcription factor n=1 Tax=Streptomyces sp. NPDC008001 TaxID=3364804 RepID=UPI0036E9FB61
MLRIHCTPQDLLNVTVADHPAPLLELSLAFAALQRRDVPPEQGRWWKRSSRGLPRAAHPLLQLVSPQGAGPLFLDPPAEGFAEGLDTVLAAPRARVRAELRRVCGTGLPVTPWLRSLADLDRAAWKDLERALRTGHQHVIRPQWARLESAFRAETAWRSRVIAQQGLQAAITSLAPGTRWRALTLESPLPREAGITLRGKGIVLVPTFFWTGHLLAAPQPDGRLFLVHPAVTPLSLHPLGPADDPLVTLLGSTRARILGLLVHRHTTTDLARQLTMSISTASTQTKALRYAGLVDSRREGRAVWHWCTPLGLDLLVHAHRSAS